MIRHIPVRLGFPHDEYHGSRELLPCDSAIFFPLGWVEDLPEGGTRHLVGWDPKMEGNFEEIWRSGNSWWRLEPGRAVRCDIGIILTPDNVVACVAKINGIIKRDDMRMGFIGKPIHGDYDNWIGKTLERNDSKNPIAYFDERAILPPSKVTKDTEKLNR